MNKANKYETSGDPGTSPPLVVRHQHIYANWITFIFEEKTEITSTSLDRIW